MEVSEESSLVAVVLALVVLVVLVTFCVAVHFLIFFYTEAA
jgi:hypothetical protein